MFDRKNNGTGNKLMSCKHETLVATHNVRTIRSKHKREELANAFNLNNINILGIVDHKIVHNDDTILTEELNNCTLITSSAWRNANNSASGGVGLLVNKLTEKALISVDPFNERIMCAHFSGNPSTTVIVHYAPTEGSDNAIEHYSNLKNAINDIPKHNVILVVGDFNAHIGKESARFSYHENTNSNGKLLLELAEETNMVITNTMFQKRKGKLWTFISDMTGTKTQIDYILINKKWRNSVKDVAAYSTFSSIGSDHRVVTARLKLSLRMSLTPPRKNVYEWAALRSDKDLQYQYTVQVKNRYAELCTVSNNKDVTNTYQNLIQANEEAAKDLMPTKKRTKRKITAKDPRIIVARQSVNDAFSKFETDPSEVNHTSLQSTKTKLKDVYDRAFEEELENMISKVENADHRAQHALSWKLINEITGRKSTKKGIIKGSSKEDRVKKWYEHFSQLLGKEPDVPVNDVDEEIPTVLHNINIKTGPFTMEEYKVVKKSLKSGQSGEDGIPPEVLKYCDLDDTILEYANKLLQNGEKPQQWSDINLIPIPKSGDLGYTTNYRGIGLSAVVTKMVNKMLLNRIQPQLDPHLRHNQNGFRPHRSTTSHILALRRIIEGVKRNHLKATLLFVDFSKAFDSIHRGKMIKILRAYGIPEQIVLVISKLYEGTRAKVLSPDGETEYFNILAGVLQGDTLAPFLFAIVIDYVMRKAVNGKEAELGFTLHCRKSRRIPPVSVTDLDFADDIALLSNEIYQAKVLLGLVETEAAKVGLHVNAKKTEVMLFNQDEPNDIQSISGDYIKDVTNFKYLGGWMKSSEDDIKVRKALAWAACHKLKKIWSSKLKKSLKVRLFLSTVESVLLYNSETWTLTQQMSKSIDGTYTRMLRMALNVSWKQHLTNVELYGSLPKVSQKIAQRRLRLAGHCIRHPEEIASQLVLWQPSQGEVNRGRKPTDYIDLIKRDTGLENINEIRNVMVDRIKWREFVMDARPGGRLK